MGDGLDILVVDDTPANLTLLSYVLSRNGYAVRTATSANEALESIARAVPAAMIVDVQMPGMDGLELTRVLRTRDSTKNIVIVAVTAYAMKGDEERALASGCDGYISKPVDTRTLAGQLAAVITRCAGRGA